MREDRGVEPNLDGATHREVRGQAPRANNVQVAGQEPHNSTLQLPLAGRDPLCARVSPGRGHAQPQVAEGGVQPGHEA